MLDISLFRIDAGGDPDVVRESQRRRGANVDLVSTVVELDERWRAQLQLIKAARDAARAEVEAAGLAAKAASIDGSSADLAEAKIKAALAKKQLATQLEPLERAERTLRTDLHSALVGIGTLVHEHAPLCPALMGMREPETAGAAALDHSTSLSKAAHATALQALVAAGWAESLPAPCSALHARTAWRARGPALLAQHTMVGLALDAAARAGYTLLPWPVPSPQVVSQKFQKLRQDRGELSGALHGSASTPPGASSLPTDDIEGGPIRTLHAASWLLEKELPIRYVFIVDGEADGSEERSGSGPHVYVSELWPDDGSAWEALDEVARLSQAVHAQLGLAVGLREAHTGELKHAEARAFVLESRMGRDDASVGTQDGRDRTPTCQPAASSIELARAWCSEGYTPRLLGIRCGGKMIGERSKRYVHMVGARICSPTRYLLALAATSPALPLPAVLLRGLPGSLPAELGGDEAFRSDCESL
jgi:seryl-tRNA synthetase